MPNQCRSTESSSPVPSRRAYVDGGNNPPPSFSSDGRCVCVCNVEPLDQLAMQLHHFKREPVGACKAILVYKTRATTPAASPRSCLSVLISIMGGHTGPQQLIVRGDNNLPPTFGAEADVSSNVYSGRGYLNGITLPPAEADSAGEYIHCSKSFPSFVTFLIHILLNSSWCSDVPLESIP